MISAVTVNVYDWFLTFSGEVWHIWCNRKLPKRMRILFIIMRYVALIVLIGRCVWFYVMLADYPIPPSRCNAYHAFKVGPPVILSSSTDLLLLLRVWALSSRNRRTLYFLVATFLSQVIIITAFTIPHGVEVSMDALCIVYAPPIVNVSVAVSVIFFQTLTWAMTMHRCYFALKRTWCRDVFATQLMRDGTGAWLTLCTVYLVGIISTEKIPSSLMEVVNPWVITTRSIVACRMVLNMQEMASTQSSTAGSNDDLSTVPVQLTTNVLFFESQMMHTTGGLIADNIDIPVEICMRTDQDKDEIELLEVGSSGRC